MQRDHDNLGVVTRPRHSRIVPIHARNPAGEELRDVIEAFRAANTDGDLAAAWICSRSQRLGMSTTDQILVVMAWIDRVTELSLDDGR